MREQAEKALSQDDYTLKVAKRPKYLCDVPLKRRIPFKKDFVHVVDHFDAFSMVKFDQEANDLMNGRRLRYHEKDNDVQSVSDDIERASNFAIGSVELSVKVFQGTKVNVDTLLAQGVDDKTLLAYQFA